MIQLPGSWAGTTGSLPRQTSRRGCPAGSTERVGRTRTAPAPARAPLMTRAGGPGEAGGVVGAASAAEEGGEVPHATTDPFGGGIAASCQE